MMSSSVVHVVSIVTVRNVVAVAMFMVRRSRRHQLIVVMDGAFFPG